MTSSCAHADQAMAMLSDIDDTESSVLSELPYSENEVVLHTDTRLLQKATRVVELELSAT